jgi:hypothetical protein
MMSANEGKGQQDPQPDHGKDEKGHKPRPKTQAPSSACGPTI